MPTTYTPKRGLSIPAFKDRNWHLPLIASLTMLDTIIDGGGLNLSTTETPSTTLRFAVSAGTYRKADGTLGTFPGAGPVTVLGSSTTYIWLTDAGVLTRGAPYPTGTNIVRLGTVVSSATAITAINTAKVIDVSFGAPEIDLSGTYPANQMVAGPASGAAAALAVRSLVPADLPVFIASGATHAAGAVPDPGSTAGARRLLCEDGTWKVSPVFIASGSTHAVGAVPDPGVTAGTRRVLFEDGTWANVNTKLPKSTYGTSPSTMVLTSTVHVIQTVPMTFNLSSVTAVPDSIIWIVDFTGSASVGSPITVTPSAGESINGSTSAVTITTARGVMCLYSFGSGGWLRFV